MHVSSLPPTAAARDRALSRDVRRRNVVALLQHALKRYVAALDLSGCGLVSAQEQAGVCALAQLRASATHHANDDLLLEVLQERAR